MKLDGLTAGFQMSVLELFLTHELRKQMVTVEAENPSNADMSVLWDLHEIFFNYQLAQFAAQT